MAEILFTETLQEKALRTQLMMDHQQFFSLSRTLNLLTCVLLDLEYLFQHFAVLPFLVAGT